MVANLSLMLARILDDQEAEAAEKVAVANRKRCAPDASPGFSWTLENV